MSELLALQQQFAESSAWLILQAIKMGYQVTHGETFRSLEECKRDAAAKIGIEHSLHGMRLAIDLNFFKDGEYVTDTKELTGVGNFWKSLGGKYRWGGDFTTRPDGNHFSITPDGVRA